MLFVLDDSPTMAAALGAWRASLPHLASTLASFADAGAPISFHIGAVTADLGAGGETLPALGCHPGGDDAKLHTGTLSLSGGVRFVDDNQLAGTTNFAGDLAAALDALSDVGTTGCSFPSRSRPRTARCMTSCRRTPASCARTRCSSSSSSPTATTARRRRRAISFDPASTSYGTLDRFRCTQFGIACGGMPVPAMAISGLTGCESQTMASGGKLIDVQQYLDFFGKPAAQGGVKVDPHDVILAAIAAPTRSRRRHDHEPVRRRRQRGVVPEARAFVRLGQ